MSDYEDYAVTREGLNDTLEALAAETVTAATCRIRAAHLPHGQCPGTAPEFPWEQVIDPEARG